MLVPDYACVNTQNMYLSPTCGTCMLLRCYVVHLTGWRETGTHSAHCCQEGTVGVPALVTPSEEQGGTRRSQPRGAHAQHRSEYLNRRATQSDNSMT